MRLEKGRSSQCRWLGKPCLGAIKVSEIHGVQCRQRYLTVRLEKGSSSQCRWLGSAKPSRSGTSFSLRSASSGASPAAAACSHVRLLTKLALASAALQGRIYACFHQLPRDCLRNFMCFAVRQQRRLACGNSVQPRKRRRPCMASKCASCEVG